MEEARQQIIEKIKQLLNKEQSPQKIYEWSLRFIISKEYEVLKIQDPVATKAIQMLLDVNEDRKVGQHELEVLEYYCQCLMGNREYIDLAQNPDIPKISEEVLKLWLKAFGSKELSQKDKILHWMRIYIYIFAVYLLLVNILVLFRLGGPWSSKRIAAIMTYPFLIYGSLLILPMQVLVKGKFFLITIIMSILAFTYFLFFCFQLIFNGFYVGSFLVYLFLGVIPAAIVLWLLFYEKNIKNSLNDDG